MARTYAFDPNDADEVDAWREAFSFMRDGSTALIQENVLRTTIWLGQMTAASMEKTALTVYRLDGPPYLLLPDLPVLGWSPAKGDLPDPVGRLRCSSSTTGTWCSTPACPATRSGTVRTHGSARRFELGSPRHRHG